MSKSRRRSRSPIEMEQGEVNSSPLGHSPDVVIVENEDDFSLSEEEEEEVEGEVMEEEASAEPEKHEDEDSLEIKPPQRQAGKKDRHKHKRKDDRPSTKDRDRDRNRDRDRDRGRRDRDTKGRQRDREKDLQREREDKARSLEKQKQREEELVREAKRREKSRKERERLENLERERKRLEREREREHRERLMRAEREREREMAERAERNRREEERRRQAPSSRQERREKEKSQSLRKEGSSASISGRSRSPLRKELRRDYESRDVSSSSRDREGKRRRERELREEEPERKMTPPVSAAAPLSEPEEYMETEVGEHTPSEEEEEEEVAKSSTGSESDSSDSGSESSVSERSSEGSLEKHLDLKTRSKFDDDDEEEEEIEEEDEEEEDDDEDLSKLAAEENGEASETESVKQSDKEEDGEDEDETYLQDTPPESPTELKPQLPPYYPAIQGCRNVEEFQCLNRIEEGQYGVVYRARDKKTDETVALKKLKMEREKEGFPITSLREINTLLKAQHPNIVTVREIVVGSNIDKIYIVMDYVEHDLKSLMETMKEPFMIGEVKTLLLQLLRGVAHLHDNWIIHRDLKTSNLLLSHKGILKIGDFGLAREYGSPLRQYTPIVVTLWYRAPELLLGTKEYSCPIDMWSVGCIFAEFLTRKALFPGRSEIDELNRIFKELGTPNEKIWPGVSELPAMKKCSFTEYPYNQLRNRFGTMLTDKGFDLMNRFLTYNPSRRITGEQGIKHEWFSEVPKPVSPSMFPTWPARSEQTRRSTHGNSPKPPSGGKAFSKLLGQDDEHLKGFHLGMATKGSAATGAGFSLKF